MIVVGVDRLIDRLIILSTKCQAHSFWFGVTQNCFGVNSLTLSNRQETMVTIMEIVSFEV